MMIAVLKKAVPEAARQKKITGIRTVKDVDPMGMARTCGTKVTGRRDVALDARDIAPVITALVITTQRDMVPLVGSWDFSTRTTMVA